MRAATVLMLSLLSSSCRPPPTSPECTSNQQCVAQLIEVCVQGRCVECAKDADCKQGFNCHSNRCEPRPECVESADCGAGRKCTAGACVAVAKPRPHTHLDELRESAQAQPDDANGWFNLGLGLMQSIEGRLRAETLTEADKPVVAEADAAFERAIALAPNHGRAHIMLGMLCNFTQASERAIPHLKVGMELPKDSQDWWIAADTLVNVYFNQNQPASAEPVLEQVVKVRPNEASAHYKLGLVYFFGNKPAPAKREFKRALALDPSNDAAREKLAELK